MSEKYSSPHRDPDIVEFDSEENSTIPEEVNDDFGEDPRVLGSVYSVIQRLEIE